MNVIDERAGRRADDAVLRGHRPLILVLPSVGAVGGLLLLPSVAAAGGSLLLPSIGEIRVCSGRNMSARQTARLVHRALAPLPLLLWDWQRASGRREPVPGLIVIKKLLARVILRVCVFMSALLVLMNAGSGRIMRNA